MSRRVAAIDVGTNSTRLLVADIAGGSIAEVERLLRITRLGDRVDASGELAEASMRRVLECVAGYAARARELSAERPLRSPPAPFATQATAGSSCGGWRASAACAHGC